VLIEWYLYSVPNLVQISVIVTKIDVHTLQTLVTSRESTAGFDCWSRGHLRVAVHLSMKFGADIFIHSGVIDIYLSAFEMARQTRSFKL